MYIFTFIHTVAISLSLSLYIYIYIKSYKKYNRHVIYQLSFKQTIRVSINGTRIDRQGYVEGYDMGRARVMKMRKCD